MIRKKSDHVSSLLLSTPILSFESPQNAFCSAKWQTYIHKRRDFANQTEISPLFSVKFMLCLRHVTPHLQLFRATQAAGSCSYVRISKALGTHNNSEHDDRDSFCAMSATVMADKLI